MTRAEIRDVLLAAARKIERHNDWLDPDALAARDIVRRIRRGEDIVERGHVTPR